MNNKNIVFLGCWNMWKVILNCFLKYWFSPNKIFVQTSNDENTVKIQKQYKVKSLKDNKDIQIDILVLGFKPWHLEKQDFWLLNTNKNTEIVSILWWVEINKIKEITWLTNIVRLMPNIPMETWNWSCWIYFYPKKLKNKTFYIDILKLSWLIFEIDDEKEFALITILSWCAPAFYYLFSDIFSKIWIKYWLDPSLSEKISRQILIGAWSIAKQNNKSMSNLIEQVATKWWITEKVISNFLNDWIEVLLENWINKVVKQ